MDQCRAGPSMISGPVGWTVARFSPEGGEPKFMALTADRYVGTYAGHAIELIRNKWFKTLSLWIDGERVATELYIWPWATTLNATLRHNGSTHTVVARSIPRRVLWTTDTVEVDGEAVDLTKTY